LLRVTFIGDSQKEHLIDMLFSKTHTQKTGKMLDASSAIKDALMGCGLIASDLRWSESGSKFYALAC